jgi:N-acetylglucosamine kinase-like BadF-type ATPase
LLAPQLVSVIADVIASVPGLGSDVLVTIGSTGLTEAEADPSPILAGVRGLGVSRVRLAHDSVTSYLGALGYSTGVVVAAGTGSIIFGVGESSVSRVDGWGNIIGDAGSGYWLGRAGLDAVMRSFDGRGPQTALRPYAEQQFSSLPNAYIELQTDPDHVRRVASFSKLVGELAESDEVCRAICLAAGRELGLSAVTAARNVGLSVRRDAPDAEIQSLTTSAHPKICAIGSVFKSSHVLRAFVERVGHDFPGFAPTPASGDGLDGAEALAELPESSPLATAVATVSV